MLILVTITTYLILGFKNKEKQQKINDINKRHEEEKSLIFKEVDLLNRLKSDLTSENSYLINNIELIKEDKIKLENEFKLIKEDRDNILSINENVILKIKSESIFLPSVVSWMDKIQETIDTRDSDWLISKKQPAIKAHEAVKQAKKEAREWRRKAQALESQINLYEAQVPWIVESIDYSLDEINEGLRIAESEKLSTKTGDDPARIYIAASEWEGLSPLRRSEISLERYFETRQKSAWLAGVMYERFVGHMMEMDGFSVIYHGAINGVNDLGIDLIGEKEGLYKIVQCKRLSPIKGIPVRENVVAQIYGASLVFAQRKNIPFKKIRPTIVTSYDLSVEAREFASILKVEYFEMVELQKYPCIKCNIAKNGEKIYHLPFDQQYDSVKINKKDGDMYVMNPEEAEAAGFRRAYRWSGSK